jgi:hypothetical protein
LKQKPQELELLPKAKQKQKASDYKDKVPMEQQARGLVESVDVLNRVGIELSGSINL